MQEELDARDQSAILTILALQAMRQARCVTAHSHRFTPGSILEVLLNCLLSLEPSPPGA